MTYKEFRSRFKRLSAIEQQFLKVTSIFYEPLAHNMIGNLAGPLNLQDSSGLPLSVTRSR